jgi:hypothetical protein
MTISAERLQSCPVCACPATVGRFDVTVGGHHGEERHFFGLPAGVCGPCGRVEVDAHLARLLDIDPARVVFAIQSDSCLTGARRLGAA